MWAVVAILRAAAQARMPLAKHKVLVRDYRNNGGTEFHAVAARKGESYEAADSNQGWTSQPEPQHDRSLTLLGHVPIPRSEVMPRKYQMSEHKGESYEAEDQDQGWTSQPEPQHHRSLTLVGHVPIPRSEVMPRKYQMSEREGES